ncbi:MAG: Ycf66 family protein [Oscillatoriophycideae cyanobacterium NC_groundwater_1537_Pr4_S-0.65um_50_18]|nr:Ycf66 family protein [Oscillatoriophycideae cyanobacterium NC_groundwater_1537_Pr4_S-0.65um_50_18]
MLAYILALAVCLGSLSLYLSAFALPEIYRKHDLLWSGLGLFYALVLWTCAGRITGSLLLGQMASVALLGWLGWQTLMLRFAQMPLEQRMGESLQAAIQIKLAQLQTIFEDGSWRVYVAKVLDRLPDRVANFAKTLQGWLEALISTTLSSLIGVSNAVPKATPEAAPETTPKAPPDIAAEMAVNPVFEEIAAIDRPIPPSRPSARDLASRLAAANSLTPDVAAAEVALEWDDLEPEVHPELETIDGVGWDFHAESAQGQAPDASLSSPKPSKEPSD